MSSRFVGACLVMLFFVVLLPFTTGRLGDVDDRMSGEVAATGYALSVSMVSLMTMVLVVVAAHERLDRRAPTVAQMWGKLIGLADTPVVFLLSISVTIVAAGLRSLLVAGAGGHLTPAAWEFFGLRRWSRAGPLWMTRSHGSTRSRKAEPARRSNGCAAAVAQRCPRRRPPVGQNSLESAREILLPL